MLGGPSMADNIFVDHADPTKITGIIDWQATHISPFFLQVKFPSIFDCDDPSYPWGATNPELPEDHESMSPADQQAAKDHHARIRLKKLYEMASRKLNPGPIRAMGALRNDADPTTFIFHLVGRSAVDRPVPLRELLIQIFEKWEWMCAARGVAVSCPIGFGEEEISRARWVAGEWAGVFNE